MKHCYTMIPLLFLLQVFDAASTAFWVGRGYAIEANPAMAWLIEQGMVWFVLVKLALGSVSCYVLYMFRHVPLNRFAVWFAVAIYGALALWHIVAGSILTWRHLL